MDTDYYWVDLGEHSSCKRKLSNEKVFLLALPKAVHTCSLSNPPFGATSCISFLSKVAQQSASHHSIHTKQAHKKYSHSAYPINIHISIHPKNKHKLVLQNEFAMQSDTQRASHSALNFYLNKASWHEAGGEVWKKHKCTVASFQNH